MANKVINIATKYNEGLVVNLDKSDFFRLGKDSCQRGELFNFALALGVHQGYPSEIDKKVGFIRTESIGNNKYLYESVYFKEKIEGNLSNIDKITDENDIINTVEQYVSTGLNVLQDKKNSISEEEFMYSLFTEMDEIYKDFAEELDVLYK